MKSYDLLIHKEIVRLLRAEGVIVRDDTLGYNKPMVIISESDEIPDNSKTFDRNTITYSIKMWGSKNGSNVEIKELKAKVVQALSEGVYNIPGYIIDMITIENVATFKELENANGNSSYYYYQSVLNISYKIKEE